MNKIKFLIIALAGLIACSCGNREIAFPDECLTFDTPSGKALKVACVFHASLAFEYDGTVIQVDPVTQMGQMRIDYSGRQMPYLLPTTILQFPISGDILGI